MYRWRALDEFAIASYWTGKFKDAQLANQKLLTGSTLPANERERVERNQAFCRDKLAAQKR